MPMRYSILTAICFMFLFSSCKIFRSNLMLKTPKDYTYDKLIDSLSTADYKIAPNDAIVYRIFTNNGFKLIDMATSTTNAFRTEIDVMVESDGFIKLPLLGHLKIAGLTIKEAERIMEEKYDSLYVNPFVSIRITNKRVIVFPGNGGSAKVLTLVNNNTTVMESIANAGGILEDGKAYKVKLIRSNPEPTAKPFVYLMDLSTIKGINAGRSIVQAGDIIYVEPRYRPLLTFSKEIAPIVSLITSALILYQFSKIR